MRSTREPRGVKVLGKMLPSRSEPLRAGTVVPSFRGMLLERFLVMIEGIDDLSSGRQREAVLRELEWCSDRPTDTLDHMRHRATLMVLRDLLGQGWQIQYRQRSIFLARPDYSHGCAVQLDPTIVKAQIREAMREERFAKLCAPAARRFIMDLERESPQRKSIRALVADGTVLADSIRNLPDPASLTDIRNVVSPYLQQIRGDERDEFTGLRLIDVWRYFRYLWTIP